MYTIETYEGSISDGDTDIAQGLTVSPLSYKSGSAHSMEQPLSTIAWDTPAIQLDRYEVLGEGETHKLGNLVYASDLGLGGVVHSTSEEKGAFLLNSGILVTIIDGVKDTFKYSRKTKVKLSNALYRTVMSAALSSAKLNLRQIFKTQCQLRQLVEATRIHQHRNNPDGGDLLESNEGMVYELLGDIIRVSRCREIRIFVITWSRRWEKN